MKPLLLFVGKTPSTTNVLNHIFGSHYRTTTYTSAREALAYLESAPETDRPVAIVCDQNTPDDHTPIELFRGLKNNDKNDNLPAIVLCCNEHTEDHSTQLHDLGWADQIYKPFNPDGLTLRMRQLLM